MKKSFPIFGNGNGRPVFPGMAGNGNSRSPLLSVVVKTLIVSLVRQSKGRTRSPIGLFWTAKNYTESVTVNRNSVVRIMTYITLQMLQHFL